MEKHKLNISFYNYILNLLFICPENYVSKNVNFLKVFWLLPVKSGLNFWIHFVCFEERTTEKPFKRTK